MCSYVSLKIHVRVFKSTYSYWPTCTSVLLIPFVYTMGEDIQGFNVGHHELENGKNSTEITSFRKKLCKLCKGAGEITFKRKNVCRDKVSKWQTKELQAH